MNRKLLYLGIGFISLVIIFILNYEFPSALKEEVHYEKVNYVYNGTGKQYLEDAVHIGLDHLDIQNVTVAVKIGIPARGTEDDGVQLQGFIVREDGGYLIVLYDLKFSNAIRILAHELAHLHQYHTQELIKVGDKIIYQGKIYNVNNLPPYQYRPWEQDAFERMDDIELAILNELLQ